MKWNPDHYATPFTTAEFRHGLQDTDSLEAALKRVGYGDDPRARVFDAKGVLVADGAFDAVQKWKDLRAARG